MEGNKIGGACVPAQTMGWAATYRTLGPKGFVSYAVARVAAAMPRVAYHRYHIVAVPRSGMPSMPRGHAVRALDAHEIGYVAGDVDLTPATIDFRLKQGMRCLAAFRGERLLGVTWLTERPFDEDEVSVRFVPPPGAAWDTGLYVRPEDRGGRAFAALWAGTAEWLRERGLDWSVSRINDYNDASWRSHMRMGGCRLDTLTALRVGEHQWIMSARPRHIRLKADVGPPVLLLPMPGVTA